MNASTNAAWTIGQLATRVAEALAAGVPGQANGRVREVPDVRTLRWYTSIGLLDRPAAMRGRTALYGRRHLLQVVAVKRLQGEGWSLAEIQERLIGAGDAVLEEIAALPEAAVEAGVLQDLDASSEEASPVAPRARFWASAPAEPDASAQADSVTLSRSAAPAAAASPRSVESSPEPAVGTSATPPRPAARAARAARVAGTPATPPMPAARAPRAADASAVEAELSALGIPPWTTDPRRPTIAQAIRLASDVTLVLDTRHPPDPADLHAIAEAARPLLELLQHLGLSES